MVIALVTGEGVRDENFVELFSPFFGGGKFTASRREDRQKPLPIVTARWQLLWSVAKADVHRLMHIMHPLQSL